MAINIPSRVYDDFNEAVVLMERTIVLSYPEKKDPCPNCYLDTMGTRNRSISRYKVGGPDPFEDGMPCPYCGGRGYIESVVTEIIPARIYLEPEQWSKTLNIKIPKGAMMTIFRTEYTSKVRSCKHMNPNYNDIETHFTDNYYRQGDIYSNSFTLNPVKYSTAIWAKTKD